jgi:dihydroorotate dehydrogenase (fumarate)
LALMHHGLPYLERVRNDLGRWLEYNGWDSVRGIQGQLSRQAVADPAVFERVNYMHVLSSYRPDLHGTHGSR